MSRNVEILMIVLTISPISACAQVHSDTRDEPHEGAVSSDRYSTVWTGVRTKSSAGELNALIGADRTHLAESTVLNYLDSVVPLAGVDRHRGFFGFQPWLVSRIPTNMGERIVVVEAKPAGLSDGSEAVVTIFGLEGTCFFASRFPAGDRIVIEDASLATERGLSLLVVQGVPVLGRDITRQYYAIHDDLLTTARLSDSHGRAARNCYNDLGAEFGPRTSTPSLDIEVELKSGNLAKVLAALDWLSGERAMSRNGPENGETQTYETARAKMGVESALASLSSSDDPWVQEAVRLARSNRVTRFP